MCMLYVCAIFVFVLFNFNFNLTYIICHPLINLIIALVI